MIYKLSQNLNYEDPFEWVKSIPIGAQNTYVIGTKSSYWQIVFQITFVMIFGVLFYGYIILSKDNIKSLGSCRYFIL